MHYALSFAHPPCDFFDLVFADAFLDDAFVGVDDVHQGRGYHVVIFAVHGVALGSVADVSPGECFFDGVGVEGLEAVLVVIDRDDADIIFHEAVVNFHQGFFGGVAVSATVAPE